MRARFVRSSLAILIALALPSCGDPPTFEQPPTIAFISVSGCAVVALDATCTFTAEAIDTEGDVMADPPLLWESSSRLILKVDGFGTSATGTPVSIGVVQVIVRDAAGLIDPVEHRVRVTECEEVGC